MAEARKCSTCGTVIPPHAPAGHCPACLLRIALGVAPASDDSPVRVVAAALPKGSFGDYELLEEVASGGMGVVFKARQLSLNRLVAVKMIRAGQFANEMEVARFRSEAEAAAQLDHPNIVPIYEVGERDGRHYFSMKLIEGQPLSSAMAGGCWFQSFCPTHRPARSFLPAQPACCPTAAQLMARVARAVHYAHQHGILHRDLKPGNILLDAQGQPHVTDFGLAGRVDADSLLTLSGSILGTPAYMAPEQAAGAKTLTTSADIHSLGAILYELLTGQPPFRGATVMETLQKVINEEPVPPSIVQISRRKEAESSKSEIRNPKAESDQSLLPLAATGEVDRDLETICLKCLQKDPQHRYGSAEGLAEDLERWLEHRPIRARPVGTGERFVKWVRRKPALAALVLALHLVVLAGMAGIFWQWQRARSATRQVREELWHSQLIEARAYRLNSGPGRRAKALEVIARAAAYRPSIELRNEALAALALPDLGSSLWWRNESLPERPFTFTSDLAHFAGLSADGRIAVWRGVEPQPVAFFRGFGAVAKTMRFSPDDTLLAVKFENGAIGVWRWRDQQLVLHTKSWPDNSDHAPPFDFTPDGREFWLSDSNQKLARFSLPDGQPLPPSAIAAPARRLRFDPTGRRLVGWSGQTLTAWDIATGSQVGEWLSPGIAWCLAWHPSGNGFALGTFHAGVHFAEIGQTNLVALESDADANAVFTDLAFTPDGTFVLAGGDWGNTISMWNFATRRQELRSRGHCFRQLSRDGTQVAAWDVGHGYGVRTFLQPIGIRRLRVPTVLSGGGISSAAWHPDGRWLVTGHPHGWVVWNTTSGQVEAEHVGRGVRTIQFLPGGDAFLSGGEDGAQLWPFDARGRTPQVGPPKVLTPPNAVANERAALSPDGRRFAAVGEHAWLGSVTDDSAPVRIEQGERNTWLNFSQDGRWVCLCQFKDTQLKIRDGFTGAFVTNLPAAGFRFTPAGDQLVSFLPGRITFWQVGTWARLRELPIGDDRKHSSIVDFWPDGSCALTLDQETMLQLWNVEANREIATLWLPVESGGGSAVFDPSGYRMAVTAGRPYLDLWDFSALRRELARLGLDWPGEHPSERFTPLR